MADPSRSSSYYGEISNEFYSPGFDGYQNDISESLDFSHVTSSDFYLGPEIYLVPQMLDEQPYPSQPIFTGITSIYEQFQPQPFVTGTNATRTTSQTQLSSGALHENLNQIPTEPRENTEDPQDNHAVEGKYYEHCNEENLEHSRKKRRPSEVKKTQAPNIPQANVFKVDLKTPSISHIESQPVASQESLSSVFEVNLNQPPKRKARSAFTPQGKKKVEAVRSVGACIQCKFRKRTCGINEPCMLCIRRAGSVESATSLCTRESPFLELSLSEFYSTCFLKCMTDFDVDLSNIGGQQKTIKIDGKGPVSSPFCLKVIEVHLSSLGDHALKEVRRIRRLNSGFSHPQNADPHQSDTITGLDWKYFSSQGLEEWVMKYTDGNKIDNVNSTSFLFGVAYTKEKLPHADLVEDTTKLIALSYMLCKGLKITALPGQQNTAFQYPVLRAQLETKIFNLLYNAEKLVYQELQRLVFKTSGQLPKDAFVPVALVLWLLTRLQSLKTSHLTNLSEGSDSPSSASHQKHVLNLLISVFTALFRSSFPLLMNFEDKGNRDLLGGNEDLIQLSKKLKRDLIEFKRNDYLKAWSWNKGFLKEQVGRLRDVLTE